jgi:hypothetical protein
MALSRLLPFLLLVFTGHLIRTGTANNSTTNVAQFQGILRSLGHADWPPLSASGTVYLSSNPASASSFSLSADSDATGFFAFNSSLFPSTVIANSKWPLGVSAQSLDGYVLPADAAVMWNASRPARANLTGQGEGDLFLLPPAALVNSTVSLLASLWWPWGPTGTSDLELFFVAPNCEAFLHTSNCSHALHSGDSANGGFRPETVLWSRSGTACGHYEVWVYIYSSDYSFADIPPTLGLLDPTGTLLWFNASSATPSAGFADKDYMWWRVAAVEVDSAGGLSISAINELSKLAFPATRPGWVCGGNLASTTSASGALSTTGDDETSGAIAIVHQAQFMGGWPLMGSLCLWAMRDL